MQNKVLFLMSSLILLVTVPFYAYILYIQVQPDFNETVDRDTQGALNIAVITTIVILVVIAVRSYKKLKKVDKESPANKKFLKLSNKK